MLASLLLGTVIVMRGWPETAAARWLHRTMAEPLARAFDRTTRVHVIYAFLLIAIMIGATEYLAMAGSLDLGLVFVWDLAAYVDIIAVGFTVATVARGHAVWTAIGATLPRARPRRRIRQSRRRTRTARRADRDRPATSPRGTRRVPAGTLHNPHLPQHSRAPTRW